MYKVIAFLIIALIAFAYFFTDTFINIALVILGLVTMFYLLRFAFRYRKLRGLYDEFAAQDIFIIAVFDYLAVEEKYVSGVDGFSGSLKFVDNYRAAQLYDDIYTVRNIVEVFSNIDIHSHADNYKFQVYERMLGPFQLQNPGAVFFASSIRNQMNVYCLCEVSFNLIELDRDQEEVPNTQIVPLEESQLDE